jgi:hypothetical protein
MVRWIVSTDEVKLELDGGGVEPSTVAARSLIDLASAFLEIIERVAAEEQIEVTFRGLSVENKCVALVTRIDPPGAGQELSKEALKLITGEEPTRRGLEGPVQRARTVVEHLPDGITANVIVGPWKALIVTTEPDLERYPVESTELRAIPIRVGGRRTSVRFGSESEDQEFTLDASADLCRRIGPHLYKEIDVYVRLRRNSEGTIEGGVVDEFFPVEARDNGESLRAWFSESAPEWGDVNDVVRELDRRD